MSDANTDKFIVSMAFTLIVGLAVYFILYGAFYQKSEVYSKTELDKVINDKLNANYLTKSQVQNLIDDKQTCKYHDLMFNYAAYSGQTPRSICQNTNMQPQFLFIRRIATATNNGLITYVDEPSYSASILNFDDPLGQGKDIPREYGRPDSSYKGTVNEGIAGLLCC